MQHKPSIEIAKFAVRQKICPKCYQRPHGSEKLGPMVARSCEPTCTIFLSLNQMQRALAELSHQLPDVALIPYPVVSDRLRVEPWWTNGTTTKVVLSEYFKYLAAKLRMQFESAPASS